MTTDSLRTAYASAYAGLAKKVAVHQTDPGTTGAGMVGTRKALTWTAGAAGVMTSNEVVLPIPADTDIGWVTVWDANDTLVDTRPYAVSFAGAAQLRLTLTYTEPA